ncbi:MAG: PP2C family protein-serine/threonine phosphatase [Planctomycetota bacterium]
MPGTPSIMKRLAARLPRLQATTYAEALRAAVWYRTAAVALVLMLIMAASGLRTVIFFDPDARIRESPLIPAALLAMVVYELLVLAIVSMRKPDAEPLSTRGAIVNALFECSFPAILMLLVYGVGLVTMEQAVLSPFVGLYGVFILLSVLQMKPVVCVICGFTSGASYTALVWLVVRREQADSNDPFIPAQIISGLSPILVATGIAAALVANRVRAFVRIAINEAEKRARSDRDLRAASLIQQSLMPKTAPDLPGYEVYGWNRPADETGGDYYDWVPLEDGRLAVCIADVTGHGLGPAMVTCFCRAYARSALRVESRVASAVHRLNEELVSDLSSGKFVTFATAVVGAGDDHIVTLSAGHGPILIYRAATRTIDSFNADGVPLGITPWHEELDAVSHRLEPGDALILITDGFFEWADTSGRQWGTQKLKDSITRHGDKPIDQFIPAVLAELESYAKGVPQPDDLTAVVVRRSITGG